MTVLIHAHNSEVLCTGKRTIQPISASPFKGKDIGESRPMGIAPKFYQHPESDNHLEIDISERILDMQLIVPIYLTSIQKLKIVEALKNTKLHQMAQHVYTFQPLSFSQDNHK